MKSFRFLSVISTLAVLWLSHSPAYASSSEKWKFWIDLTYIYKGAELRSKNLMFVTHASSDFDGAHETKSKIETAMADALVEKIPVAYLTQGDPSYRGLYSYYLPDHRPDYLIAAVGGKLDAVAELKAEKMIFTGGYFELCLGDTVRDAILLNSFPSKVVHTIFISDAIFSYWSPLGMGSLGKFLRNSSDERIIKHLDQFYFTRHDGSRELGYQKSVDRHVRLSDYTFQIYIDFRKIGEIGSGAQQVRMDFVVDRDWKEFL